MALQKCPDCGGELEKGRVVDYSYGGGTFSQYVKVEGVNQSFIVDVSEKRVITALRCTKCNRIFQYASEDVIKVSPARRTANKMMILLVCVMAILLIITIAISSFVRILM